MRVLVNGDRLDIQASVDLAGLKSLQELLKQYEGILEMTARMNTDERGRQLRRLPAYFCLLQGGQCDVAKPRYVALASMRCGNDPFSHFLN